MYFIIDEYFIEQKKQKQKQNIKINGKADWQTWIFFDLEEISDRADFKFWVS